MADDPQRPARADRGIRLGTILGAPVVLMPSWFLVVLVVALLFAPTVRSVAPQTGTTGSYLAAVLFAVLLLGSVFLHELSHAVAARALGMPPSRIVLDLWGGHTAFERDFAGPGRSIVVAAVGPLTNLVIAVAAGAAWRAQQGGTTGVGDLLLFALASSNAFVAIFNALPGLPLDGGRVLQGVVWAATRNRATGTLVAGWCGRVVAVLVALYVVRNLAAGASSVGSLWLLFIALMLWQGATSAIGQGRWQRRAPDVVAGRLARRAVTVPAWSSVADAELVRGRAVPDASGVVPAVPLVVVVDEAGRPVGVVDEAAAAGVPPDRAAGVPVTAVLRPLDAATAVDAALAGEALLGALQQQPREAYPVVASGRVVGVLRWDDVAAAVGP